MKADFSYNHFVLTCLFLVISFSGCMRDLSGLTMDSKGRLLAVNNRPGLFARCEETGEKLQCHALPFSTNSYRFFDFEGVVSVTDELYYAVIEKRNNQCLSGCELSQEVWAFRILPGDVVSQAACSPIIIPLFSKDNPHCSHANCGLEGVAYDKKRNSLFVVKEAEIPRLFVLPLRDDHCPSGEIVPIPLPVPARSLNGLSVAKERDSLFLLSTRDNVFYEWSLKTKTIISNSKSNRSVQEFMKANRPVEGIVVDEKNKRVLLLAENGKTLSVPLPQRGPNQ